MGTELFEHWNDVNIIFWHSFFLLEIFLIYIVKILQYTWNVMTDAVTQCSRVLGLASGIKMCTVPPSPPSVSTQCSIVSAVQGWHCFGLEQCVPYY